jgi:hypothetical protein
MALTNNMRKVQKCDLHDQVKFKLILAHWTETLPMGHEEASSPCALPTEKELWAASNHNQ